ncbi:Sulfate transporter/antisigma-factor antagonist STAS (plasmid) [Trichormus variabilis ATCC 29413]|uniref:Sulfate transporter/antisigma-factor antagonist STAS n=2 Tax=Anabaena variabilis TaxID=264691 RepID=Q3M2H0_TRIV2|nr:MULTISPECIES: SulP family inorganic anion transporter [Nostocaceae]ABA24816.1 Sulfate transporter/antisigma-factor antagonist STAS [Trichormus variabilis ATCC 29413]MBC1218065.1 SulP family inorganic anion transporter [Trichormus variabilis ARAD]MBC1259090.1 SulP family inorganic anion transporter [Trichormus variabilis V5]MBC1270634.1 SulP family inorganic anion transporter [Trichormus variabilis FSR]MBC1305488.1 SulP family inorganic anion transporter [Trichormus variabilis N2B]
MSLTNSIHFRNLQGDLFGGLTAAIVSLPLALAFGVASGAGAVAGLYGAVCVGFFAALFGGTPTLISEPTGPMTVIMTAVISSMTASNPEDGLAMAFTVVMLAGIFQILFGIFKLGKYITLMPYSVISGFMSGIGVILVILQIAPFLGQPSPKGGVLGMVQNLPQLLTQINPVETTLGLLTLAIIFFMPRQLKRFAPPQLVALIVGTIVSLTIFGAADIRRIGEIPAGLPTLQIPTFTPSQITIMIVDGAILGMLGCIDTLLTAVIAESLTRTEHKPDKELIGQGIGNLISGLCGGLPGAGATMGTVVNIQTGARTALSGLTRALILLVVVLWAASITQPIPMAVLAGIALKVGIDILDWSFLKRAHKVSFKATIIMYSVLFLTVFVDLIVAVGVGVFIANILTIERLSQLQSEDVRMISDTDDAIVLNEQEKQLLKQAHGRVVLFHLSGPMIFGVSKAIARKHSAMVNYDVLIVDLSNVPFLGVTASLAIENAIKESSEQGCYVLIVGASNKVKQRLEKFGIIGFVPLHHMFVDRLEALKQAVALVNHHAGSDNFAVSILPDTHQ